MNKTLINKINNDLIKIIQEYNINIFSQGHFLKELENTIRLLKDEYFHSPQYKIQKLKGFKLWTYNLIEKPYIY